MPTLLSQPDAAARWYRTPVAQAWIVALGYALAGALWILWSDDLALQLARSDGEYALLQRWKGWFYVAVTSAALLVGLRRALIHQQEVGAALALAKAEVTWRSQHDALTALPNQLQLRDDLQAAMRRVPAQPLALLWLDIDHFKLLNESMGHGFGDGVLLALARHLTEALLPGERLYRQGGDEFWLLLWPDDRDPAGQDRAAQLLARTAEALLVQGKPVRLTASAGLSLWPADARDLDSLLRHADAALAAAKRDGRNLARLWSAELDQVAARLDLQQRLRDAVAHHKLEVWFQPLVGAPSLRVVGFEALLRWPGSGDPWVSPAAFIPEAEAAGLMPQLGHWVMEQAASALLQWHQQGHTHLRVAVNVAASQLTAGTLQDQVREVLATTGLPPASLELELTESMLLCDSPAVANSLSALKDLGVRLAIDDFGTGYSNFGYLRRFRVDCLKIDQSFVRELTTFRSERALVTAMLRMAEALELETTAEGVETAAHVSALQALGCTTLQGYALARPMPQAEVSGWLASWQYSPSAAQKN